MILLVQYIERCLKYVTIRWYECVSLCDESLQHASDMLPIVIKLKRYAHT